MHRAPAVARWLKSRGHEVFSVFDDARGLDDNDVIGKAHAENWILVTNDKDFGEKVHREQFPHRGLVLLRLDDETCSLQDRGIAAIIGQPCRSLDGSVSLLSRKRGSVFGRLLPAFASEVTHKQGLGYPGQGLASRGTKPVR